MDNGVDEARRGFRRRSAWTWARRNSSGGSDSSGMQEQPGAAPAPPSDTRLGHTDIGIDSISAPTTGSRATTDTTSSASRRPQPTRRRDRMHAVAADRLAPAGLGVLARRRLPAARRSPVSAASTNWVWNSMRIGASSAENTISSSTLTRARSAPPNAPRARAQRSARRRGSWAGTARTPVPPRKRHRRAPDATRARSGRAGAAATKYCGTDQRVHREQRRRQHQGQEPQRRRQVGHDAGHEHRAVRGVQALHRNRREVHEVALAPAAVALQLVDEVRAASPRSCPGRS